MQGKECFSKPLQSLVVGNNRIPLSVPIYDGETVIGMIMGSYSVALLSEKLFSSIYMGTGYSFTIDTNGDLLLVDNTFKEKNFPPNIFDFYNQENMISQETYLTCTFGLAVLVLMCYMSYLNSCERLHLMTKANRDALTNLYNRHVIS